MKRFSSSNKGSSSFKEFSAAYGASSGLLPAATKSISSTSRRSSYIEFPTSPQPNNNNNNGGEMVHSSHSKHPLVEITLPEIFTCSGCKEYGAGKRFACKECNYQLHDFCALSPPSLNTHPFHGQHLLLFHDKPKNTRSKCDVCGKSTKGFTFRCRACTYHMHPCCAMLSTQIKYPPHAHPLKLLPPSTTALSVGHQAGSPISDHHHPPAAAAVIVACGKCGKKRPGRVYGCTACNYHLHAVCAKEMINGLQANGITPPEKPSVLGTAVKLASQVVFEFIGGLVDGIGEGVGEAIVQNISRGGQGRIRTS